MKRPPKRQERTMGETRPKAALDLPNLISMQVKSYEELLQADIEPFKRKNIGLQAVFNEMFPVSHSDESITAIFDSYTISPPNDTPEECIRRGITYQAQLNANFIIKDELGEFTATVISGIIPLMTDNATFIVNGGERVVVSQLHRSPGICFEKSLSSKGTPLYSCRLIPMRGTWLEMGFDQNNMLHVQLDRRRRKRKISIISFLRALGLGETSEIIKAFYVTRAVKLKANISEKEQMKYVGKILAEDVINEETGESLGAIAGEPLTTAVWTNMVKAGVKSFTYAEDAEQTDTIIRMIAKDPCTTYESALKAVYKVLKPGDPATLANAWQTIFRMFYDKKRYNLGQVGVYKTHTSLGMELDEKLLESQMQSETSDDERKLFKDYIINATKKLIDLRNTGGDVDDIDHLENRRVRSVGELVQNHIRIGLTRVVKNILDRFATHDQHRGLKDPGRMIAGSPITAVLREFFQRSQLSQFMDQINPLSELTHKRRLSALGPGGLTRDRAGFEVRDVHPSHYGRICPIETPEGPNIGLINSLCCYAKVNNFGFIETPYRRVQNGMLMEEVIYLTAGQEEKYKISQANVVVDGNYITQDKVLARWKGDTLLIDREEIELIDVASNQLFSVATSLIPFLEHDDANRALMGSNMQRQAVPLLKPEAPFVGTGLEEKVARDSRAVIVADVEGVISSVDGKKIVIKPNDTTLPYREYALKKYLRSNAGTCINQIPICDVGDIVRPGDILADGPATENGELALGKNVFVAFMPWCGYNFEDAIIISSKLLREDTFTSIHIEQYECIARDTKLGREEITREIPNVGVQSLTNIYEDGIIRVGAKVKYGDILVGKVSPKIQTELSPDERLIQVIFGDVPFSVKDSSLRAPVGSHGTVINTNNFSVKENFTRRHENQVLDISLEEQKFTYQEQKDELIASFKGKVGAFMQGEKCPETISHRRLSKVIILKGTEFDVNEHSTLLMGMDAIDIIFKPNELLDRIKQVLLHYQTEMEKLRQEHKQEEERIKKGDDLAKGVNQVVHVTVASKRKLEVGDKMAGRHGNKGVVSIIASEVDMPYTRDGQTVEIILNPLGVPSRMNMGQLLETNLGFAAKRAGIYCKSPVFDGTKEDEIVKLMEAQGIPGTGKMQLFDGRTGDQFSQPIAVGYIYMMKLGHLVADKIHARATGPYSLVTQQPLGGKAQNGGQRLGEMEVWALEAYGAVNILQECLTAKSDDCEARTKLYEATVKGQNLHYNSIPESVNVLMNELRSLALNVQFITG